MVSVHQPLVSPAAVAPVAGVAVRRAEEAVVVARVAVVVAAVAVSRANSCSFCRTPRQPDRV